MIFSPRFMRHVGVRNGPEFDRGPPPGSGLGADAPLSLAETFLNIVDCPSCRCEQGLVPQRSHGATFLACPICCFWYPVMQEVVVLLPPDRNAAGFHRPVGSATPFGLGRRPLRSIDAKALAYSWSVRMAEFGETFRIGQEPLIVDVGCSTGAFASGLEPAQAYIGFDISFASLRFARQRTGHIYTQADAHRLPIKTGAVPFLVSRETLEHVDNPLTAAQELARVALRGVVVVPTLDFPFLYDPINYALVRWGSRLKFGIYGYEHQRVFDTEGWRRLLVSAGFEIQRDAPIGTGYFLNASDIFWHSMASWRTFDDLPRRAVPIRLARRAFRVSKMIHGIDGRFWRHGGASHAFELVRHRSAV
jgi:SAM-dependent methyltransferase